VKKLLKIAKQLKEVSGLITSVVIISSAALFFDSRDDKRTEREDKRHEEVMDSIAAVKEIATYNNVEIGFLSNQVYGIQDTLDDFEKEHKAQGEQIKSLVWGLKNIDRFTPDDFEEIMNEMLKKNIESSRLLRWELDGDLTRFVTEPSPNLITER